MFKNKDKKQNNNPPEGQALLFTAADTIEADIIEFKLAANNIHISKSYREAGAYLTLVLGKSSMGVDIFVSEEKLEEAKIILESAQEITDEDILGDPSFSDEGVKNENNEALKSLSKKAWWMTAAFLLVVIVFIVYYALSR